MIERRADEQQTMLLLEHARASRCALKLRDGIPYDAWLGVGRSIVQVRSTSAWWLGDWLVYGERVYRRRYRDAMRATPLDYQTLRNYAWVARQVEPSRRRDTLSFQHHAEVAALPAVEQDLLLGRAERHGWSRNELRRQLATRRHARGCLGPAGPVVLRIQVEPPREERWRQAARAAEQDLADWVAAAADEAAHAALPRRTSSVA